VAETVFQELQRYVRFGPDDGLLLRALHPLAAPRFEAIAAVFYDRILAHQEASRVLHGGESQVGQLKVSLVAWLDTLLRGPWDEAYWRQRERIGRVHVRIGLPQHYMFGAMNLVRGQLDTLVRARLEGSPTLEPTREAVGKVLDLELAIMLHTYREDLLAQQARVERLSTFGQLVGSIGHDLRNPLGVIETSLHILRGRLGDDEKALRHADRIREQVAQANGIITNLLDMIRDRPMARRPVRLAELVAAALADVIRPKGVSVAHRGVEELPLVEGDPVMLRQVLVNLVQNAVQASAPAGAVLVRGRRDGAAIHLHVEDDGPGVSPSIRGRLFEPLITTKAHGVGLGLALVKRIAEQHGGTVEYADREGGGACFTLRLPAPPEAR